MEVALIVAGGSGSRMQSDQPKQFLNLGDRPILVHTIESFLNYSDSIKIIVVIPESGIQLWKDITTARFGDAIPHKVVTGGATRTESVLKGLEFVSNDDIVAIHDGVRPFATKHIISHAFQTAEILGNAIVSVELKESLRELSSDGASRAVDRNIYRLVQTPQVFKGEVIKESYKKVLSSESDFTDDASVIEAAGYSINLIDGDYNNLKITTPEDLVVAEAILKSRRK